MYMLNLAGYTAVYQIGRIYFRETHGTQRG